MTEYLFAVTYRAVNGWSRGTRTISEVAESLEDAVIKMKICIEKSGYDVVSYRVYGFIKAVEEASNEKG